MGYQLPYKTLQIIDLRDSRIYALICAYQTMVVPSIVFGYVGIDCIFVNLSVLVIAQFAILSDKVNEALNNSENCHDGIKKLVLRHYHLIRFAEKLEDNFNIVIMQQLLGTVIHLCISGYHLLMDDVMNFQSSKKILIGINVRVFEISKPFFLAAFCELRSTIVLQDSSSYVAY
ncbi:uncharacterized protein LOC118450626 [Vespa mandarinia]|uniref:uncharacterized protein LOC118450626 n=1 Tax=Vespa mandarinia TaxID=7446 RepID=UPI0016087967|nr:uncharacterized protein LOC118450626 [Vespa mandarinia]